MKKLIFKGPCLTSSGYGVHARQLLGAILRSQRFDVSVEPIRWGETSYVNDGSEIIETIKGLAMKRDLERHQGAKYDVSVQVTIPNEFERIADLNVGVTAGIEVDTASPRWLVKCNESVDLVVVPSKHSRDVLVGSKYKGTDGSTLELTKPVVIVPEGFDASVFNVEPCEESSRFQLDAKFNFLTVGLGLDKGYGEDRKNISNLIKWFCERFKDDPDVGLVLKVGIVNNSLMDYETVRRRIADIKASIGCGKYPIVQLIHGRLSDRELAGLYKNERVGAFVTLTHGEGFGLPLIEAAACGLPVIATDWSGHLDFLTKGDRKLFVPVKHKLEQVPDSVIWDGVIERGSRWAIPDEIDAKHMMLKVAKSHKTPKKWALELAEHLRTTSTLETVGDAFVSTLLSAIEGNTRSHGQMTKQDAIASIRAMFGPDDSGKRLLYTMPMSAGDVYVSTGVVSALKKKFPDHKVFFATEKRYASILDGNPDIHRAIEYQPWMMDIEMCEALFDEVYTPNIGVQMTFSNWIHRGRGRTLALEFANHCNVELEQPKILLKDPGIVLPERYVVLHPGSGKGQWEARNYFYWQDVVDNLVKNGITVVQVGSDDEPQYQKTMDLRGKTKGCGELAHVIANAQVVVGIDSVSMHMAAGFGVRHVAIFGSSYPGSTGPTLPDDRKHLSCLLETPSRYTCDRACYKYQCSVDRDYPCINGVDPASVFLRVVDWYIDDPMRSAESFEPHRPKISGYTHVFDAEKNGYPYVESIRSMLGFCDEVIVVDGGSTDGTRERVEAIGDPRIKLITREWDWDEPGMDGMQKAFGRAMCANDSEFLWQQDADEIVHERDYEKIRELVRRFPRETDLIHLPVVELWGDQRTVRTDRHSWKWRLSRNAFQITHGIHRDARAIDERTGRTYAKKGMSDGCEYIDIMTGEYVSHRGFYNADLDRLRSLDPQEYGRQMNALFERLPSVWHASWADLPRKIRNFKSFWNVCWSKLYNDPAPVDRFLDVVTDEDVIKKAEELRVRGGEHGIAATFKLSIEPPEIMRGWGSK